MERVLKARELFLDGYNCSQAVAGAFADLTNLDEETVLKMSSSFGGGIGRMREVCGVISGMSLILGLLYGNTDPARKGNVYENVQHVVGTFKENFGSYICRDLLKDVKEISNGFIPEDRTAKYYKTRPCLVLVEKGAEILDTYIKEQQNG